MATEQITTITVKEEMIWVICLLESICRVLQIVCVLLENIYKLLEIMLSSILIYA